MQTRQCCLSASIIIIGCLFVLALWVCALMCVSARDVACTGVGVCFNGVGRVGVFYKLYYYKYTIFLLTFFTYFHRRFS